MSRAKSSQVNQPLPEWADSLGRRLRTLRTKRKVPLSTVSAVTGISASFLSLLEQGRTDVSLGRLLPLLDYYGLELSDILVDRSGPGDHVVRHAERPILFSPAEGIEVFLASRDQRRAFVPLVVEFSAGSVMVNWSRHEGDEFLMVLEGRLEIEFADADPLLLDCGDSLFITGQRDHRMAALDRQPARAIIVTTGRAHP